MGGAEDDLDALVLPDDRAGLLQRAEQMLSSAVTDTEVSGQVGIRNVKQRLDLLYGERGSLILVQSGPNRVLAR